MVPQTKFFMATMPEYNVCYNTMCGRLLGVLALLMIRIAGGDASVLEPAHDRTVGRVHCPKRSLDLFLLQGLPSETSWLPGQRSMGGARPE